MLARLCHTEGERGEADGGGHRAEQVQAPSAAVPPRVEDEQRGDDRGGADRHVDQQGPAPGEQVGQEPAEDRAGRPARRADQRAAAAEEVGDPAAEQEEAGEGQRVRIDDPLQAAGAEAQVVPHRRQGDVDDRDVQDDEELGRAGDEEPDAWAALTRYMRRCVDQRVGSLARLAGTFPATEEMFALAERGHKTIDEIVARAKAEGTLRADATSADIVLTISEMSALPGGPHRHRWLALVLDGLRSPGAGPLPGPAPDWSSVRDRWVYQESPVSRS